MGSKNKILPEIWHYLKDLEFNSVCDAFAGSNVVSYFLKCEGKRVITNDFLKFSYVASKALIENSRTKLSDAKVELLLRENRNSGFIQKTFKDIFFSDEDNAFLDRVRHNIWELLNDYERAIAHSALVRACLKKRSRGIFTFVGERYNDGRKDMQKSLEEHFRESVIIYNDAVFDNGERNESFNIKTEQLWQKVDLVYFDPPYYTPKSDNDYVRRYHFVEGLVKNWKDLEIQEHTAVKKFLSYPSPFAKKDTARSAFETLFGKWKKSTIVVSYSSNCYPAKEDLLQMLKDVGKKPVCHEIDHTYSFGNQKHKSGNVNNRVKEYLFIGR